MHFNTRACSTPYICARSTSTDTRLLARTFEAQKGRHSSPGCRNLSSLGLLSRVVPIRGASGARDVRSVSTSIKSCRRFDADLTNTFVSSLLVKTLRQRSDCLTACGPNLRFSSNQIAAARTVFNNFGCHHSLYLACWTGKYSWPFPA